MHDLYVKFMTSLAGAALAHSDRLKTIIGGLASIILVHVLAGCAVCATVLTPDAVNQLSAAIGMGALALVASLTHRDVAAPGETVEGAAAPVEQGTPS